MGTLVLFPTETMSFVSGWWQATLVPHFAQSKYCWLFFIWHKSNICLPIARNSQHKDHDQEEWRQFLRITPTLPELHSLKHLLFKDTRTLRIHTHEATTCCRSFFLVNKFWGFCNTTKKPEQINFASEFVRIARSTAVVTPFWEEFMNWSTSEVIEFLTKLYPLWVRVRWVKSLTIPKKGTSTRRIFRYPNTHV